VPHRGGSILAARQARCLRATATLSEQNLLTRFFKESDNTRHTATSADGFLVSAHALVVYYA
jgi:hypothetical protein